ncbi:MAG: hypothetical protein QOF24_2921 [Verrucomicrobiota bacterium]|jgi:hypothetical protein
MSSALAIAGVTAVLQRLINDGLTVFPPVTVPAFEVTSLPPNRVLPPANGADHNQLNLFLYRVTPNAGWRNTALPSRDDEGERRSNPPLALDLHYLLTAYGAERLNAEILLGCAMQALHESPFLTRDAVRTALSSGAAPGDPLGDMLRALGTSGLAEQIEQIKITPQTLTTEEMSKLWTAFQAPYRPTAGYLATVVLIESRRPTRQTLPVRERIIKAIPFQRPVVESVESAAGPAEPILASSTILIKGRQLRGPITSVVISGIKMVAATADDLGENEIKITLPPVLPDVLRSGIQSVQVVHEIDLGKPPAAHRAVESNVAAFILHPKAAFLFQPGVPGKVRVTFDPRVGRSQRVTLILGQRNPPPDTAGRAFNIAAPPENGITNPALEDTATITFPLPEVPADTYFCRVQVDGAESLLTMNAASQFNGPTVTVV